MTIKILEPGPGATVGLADGKLHIKVGNGTCSEVWGKLAPSTTFEPLGFSDDDTEPGRIRVSGLSSGTWTIKVVDNDKSYSQKVIVITGGGLPPPM